VSAQVDSNDVVAGLDAGADDYVTKPFVATELTARIRAALRRATIDADPSHENFAFADVEIAPASGIVTKGGEPVHLTKTEFRLLTEFARSAGLVLSRDQLLERVWGYEYLGDSRLIDAHVRRLRMKIETDPTEPKLLLTMRGLGYKLELPAEAAET
jgi:DNA-binding response OmpR family regulator